MTRINKQMSMLWFRDTFGFDELDKREAKGDGVPSQKGSNASRGARDKSEWSAPVYANFTYNEPWLHCRANGVTYHAGTLRTPSLAELPSPGHESAHKIKLDIRKAGLRPSTAKPANERDQRGHSPLNKGFARLALDIVQADVTTLHADPSNAGATFMVASQFNCLEFCHPSMTPEHGISIYAHDRTQGPACSLCCAPGTVVRNYFCFTDQAGRKTGQTSDTMINNLCDIERSLDNAVHQYFQVYHGHTIATEDGMQRLAQRIRAMSSQERTDLKRQLRVGLLEDTQVIAGQDQRGSNPHNAARHMVTQVLASACSLSCHVTQHMSVLLSSDQFGSHNQASADAWEPFARLVLEAAYEFTLTVAANRLLQHTSANPHVYLTLLGGGAFGNPLSWIIDAIHVALHKVQHVPLRVHLVLFRQMPSAGLQRLVQAWQ